MLPLKMNVANSSPSMNFAKTNVQTVRLTGDTNAGMCVYMDSDGVGHIAYNHETISTTIPSPSLVYYGGALPSAWEEVIM